MCYNRNVLRVGEWCVNPASGEISRDGQTARLDVRTQRLLMCLAEHAGEVVSIDDLIAQAWPGVSVSHDSVYQAVASLRRLLGDDPRQPTYIETVPRLGYRMLAAVGPWDLTGHAATSRRRPRVGVMWAAGVCLAVVVASLVVVNVWGNRQPASSSVRPQPLTSVAVLPFHDLTEAMTEAPFADGMTVELVDKLSKIPGLRVHAPMSSSSLKGKRSSIADLARMLDVAYVVDGSVRKSGSRLRVVARLIQADNEYVVWSETYDRPWDDILKIQDDIAGEVTKALKASI